MASLQIYTKSKPPLKGAASLSQINQQTETYFSKDLLQLLYHLQYTKSCCLHIQPGYLMEQ